MLHDCRSLLLLLLRHRLAIANPHLLSHIHHQRVPGRVLLNQEHSPQDGAEESLTLFRDVIRSIAAPPPLKTSSRRRCGARRRWWSIRAVLKPTTPLRLPRKSRSGSRSAPCWRRRRRRRTPACCCAGCSPSMSCASSSCCYYSYYCNYYCSVTSPFLRCATAAVCR